MGRRADHTRTELKALALDCASRIVEEKGLKALTVRRIARDIGYSVGTIYNLFSNLDELVLHVKVRTLDELHDLLRKAQEKPDPEDALNEMVALYLEFIQSRPNSWEALFGGRTMDRDTLPKWYRKKVERPFRIVEQVLAPYFADDDRDECALVARVLWCGVFGICSLAVGRTLNVISTHDATIMTRSLIHNYLVGLKAERKSVG